MKLTIKKKSLRSSSAESLKKDDLKKNETLNLETIKGTKFQIKVIATDLHIFNLAVKQIKKEHGKDVSFHRLPTVVRKRVMLKNFHGKGYAVYGKMKLKIRRGIFTGSQLKNYKSCRNKLKVLGLYSQNKVSF